MNCERCNKDCSGISAEKNKTYHGIDEHHNPPEFMDCYDGDVFEGKEYHRKYVMYNLCRKCHKELHQDIIIPFLNKFIPTLKFNGSEFWLWLKVVKSRREECRKLVFDLTTKWIEKEDDNDTTTT